MMSNNRITRFLGTGKKSEGMTPFWDWDDKSDTPGEKKKISKLKLMVKDLCHALERGEGETNSVKSSVGINSIVTPSSTQKAWSWMLAYSITSSGTSSQERRVSGSGRGWL